MTAIQSEKADSVHYLFATALTVTLLSVIQKTKGMALSSEVLGAIQVPNMEIAC